MLLPAILIAWLSECHEQNGPWSLELCTTLAGEFFVPCWGVDLVCMKRYEKELAAGTWDMTDIVGRHWFAGSWNKPWLLNADGRPNDRSLLQRGIGGRIPILGARAVGSGDSGASDQYRRSLLRQTRALRQ